MSYYNNTRYFDYEINNDILTFRQNIDSILDNYSDISSRSVLKTIEDDIDTLASIDKFRNQHLDIKFDKYTNTYHVISKHVFTNSSIDFYQFDLSINEGDILKTNEELEIEYFEIKERITDNFTLILQEILHKKYNINIDYLTFIIEYLNNTVFGLINIRLKRDIVYNIGNLDNIINRYLEQRSQDIFGKPVSETGFVML